MNKQPQLKADHNMKVQRTVTIDFATYLKIHELPRGAGGRLLDWAVDQKGIDKVINQTGLESNISGRVHHV